MKENLIFSLFAITGLNIVILCLNQALLRNILAMHKMFIDLIEVNKNDTTT